MADELGLNIIPRWSDFNVRFQNITRDGSGFAFSTVGAWIFVMGSGENPERSLNTLLTKTSTGVASGDFAIDNTNKNVTVTVRASEIGNGFGTYYVALFTQTSGIRNSHADKKFVTIYNQLCPTGV